MIIRAILETETMDPDFKEPFLNGMPFDITESTFDRIVRYASGWPIKRTTCRTP